MSAGTVPARPARQDVVGGPVAEVRLSGELAVCDVLAAILAAYPGVRVTGQSGPRRNRRDPGHRIYLTVRLVLPPGPAPAPDLPSPPCSVKEGTR